ncbi:MAG: GIY-YIG nuclease family protein [Desulfobacterales bacterium]
MAQYNNPEYRSTKTTKKFKGPWKLVWKRKCSSRGDAMKLERSKKNAVLKGQAL